MKDARGCGVVVRYSRMWTAIRSMLWVVLWQISRQCICAFVGLAAVGAILTSFFGGAGGRGPLLVGVRLRFVVFVLVVFVVFVFGDIARFTRAGFNIGYGPPPLLLLGCRDCDVEVVFGRGGSGWSGGGNGDDDAGGGRPRVVMLREGESLKLMAKASVSE